MDDRTTANSTMTPGEHLNAEAQHFDPESGVGHCGDGSDRFLIEPYRLSPQNIRDLTAFCDRIGCDFSVVVSPPREEWDGTLRIEMWPRGTED